MYSGVNPESLSWALAFVRGERLDGSGALACTVGETGCPRGQYNPMISCRTESGIFRCLKTVHRSFGRTQSPRTFIRTATLPTSFRVCLLGSRMKASIADDFQ